jgi:hypothetical protein
MTAVLGDFLTPASEHIARAVSWRDDLPGTAAGGIVRELSRVIMALGNFMGNLTLPDSADQARPQDASPQAVTATRLALRRSALTLRQHAAPADGTAAGDPHPAAASLSAAADCLMASRDLLQARLAPGPYHEAAVLAGQFYLAAVAASPPGCWRR